MNHLKTYEGFFSNLKKKLMPVEEPVKKVDMDELNHTVNECLIDLKDNGFVINIESPKSNMYSRMAKGSKYAESTFGKERIIYIIFISAPPTKKELNNIDGDMEITSGELPWEVDKFKVIEIKDSVLLLRDMIKSKFGLEVHVDIEDFSDDDELENYEIRFDIPL